MWPAWCVWPWQMPTGTSCGSSHLEVRQPWFTLLVYVQVGLLNICIERLNGGSTPNMYVGCRHTTIAPFQSVTDWEPVGSCVVNTVALTPGNGSEHPAQHALQLGV